jgi:putative nucleotidyltransferase with HDIG domain
VSGTITLPVLIRDARDLALTLLESNPERWRHTAGVAHRAAATAVILTEPGDVETLIAAAWLHDIGYAAPVRDTEFHPLDGARYLDRLGWPPRLVALVAHHSDARSVAQLQGLSAELSAYPREESRVADGLTYADQTIGPNGRSMTLAERFADMLRRHGPNSPTAVAHPVRGPTLRAAVDRVQRRLWAAEPTR